MKSKRLNIFTPSKKYLTAEIVYLNFSNGKYRLGITPNHAPIISSVDICIITIKMKDNHEFSYTVSGGIIYVEKENITLLVNSIERSDEIDLNRAIEAKKRAEEKLLNKDIYDQKRANLSLLRAVNRISLATKNIK